MKLRKQQLRKQLAGFLLTLLFICFTISGLILINLTFTIIPFVLFGQTIQLTVSVGLVFLLLAILILIYLLK
jgi:hypothetical protein